MDRLGWVVPALRYVRPVRAALGREKLFRCAGWLLKGWLLHMEMGWNPRDLGAPRASLIAAVLLSVCLPPHPPSIAALALPHAALPACNACLHLIFFALH